MRGSHGEETPLFEPGPGDALLLVDVQRDFLPAGALAVPEGDRVVPVLNRYLDACRRRGVPIFASRDWHPADHCSFHAQGGIWPPHCVAGTDGAAFAPDLALGDDVVVISKATTSGRDAYSAFDGTDLADGLRALGVKRLLIGGLATDYCVLETVRGAIDAGFEVLLLEDAVRAVDVEPGEGDAAIAEMHRRGARGLTLEGLAP